LSLSLSLLSSPVCSHTLLFSPGFSEGGHKNQYWLCSLTDFLYYWESTGMFCEIIFIWRSNLSSDSW
jgi:hypothetical protein